MPSCAQCGTTILFGGIRYAGQRFCKAKCANKAARLIVAMGAIPPEVLAQHIANIHDGPCDKCHQDRLVDLYPAHFVWSVVYFARCTSISELSCRSCARKRQAWHLIGSAFLGWWSFPGLIYTPIQIVRNAIALSEGESPNPSPALAAAVQTMLAERLLAAGFRPNVAQAAPPTKLTDATRGGATHGGATGRNANQTPTMDVVEPQQVDTRR